MDLKNFLSGKKEDEQELYWALVLEPGWVQAGIWEIEGEKAQIIAVSPPAAWETASELVPSVDTALSAAIQNLPEETKEPSKTVFAVPPSWVEKGQIKEDFLVKIKDICKDLSLDPKGFVVLPEAIAHLIKSEEGAPLNAIVVGLSKDFLEIAVFKLGSLAGTTAVARSVSVFDDVCEGLSRFDKVEALPSRIVIYDGKEGELEEAKQILINADWENLEKIKFLHTPKVEVLTAERKVLATALAGASEMAHVTAIAEEPAEVHQAEAFGFVMEKDVRQESQKPPVKTEAPEPQPPPTEKPISKIFKRYKETIKNINFGFGGGRKIFLTGGIFLAAFLVLFFLYWWFYPKATVKVLVSPKKFEEKVEIVVDPEVKSVDLANMVLPGEALTVEVSGEKTKATTGTKKIGDKAKGSVKIQNGTSSIINLSSGTVLLAANNLKFNLASSASISAALSPSNPGTQIIEVAAIDIGAEYNLAKDESFKVANYPKAEVDGVATADFSGGSSREISAVSSDDQKGLEDGLTDELKSDAQKKLVQSLSADKVFIDGSLEVLPLSRSFSAKVGDEAANIKLALSLKINGLAINKKDLVEPAMKVLEGSIPQGFVLKENDLGYSFDLVKKEDNKTIFNLRVIANFLPEVDSPMLAKTIAGKNPLLVEEYLTSVPGFLRAEIDIRPRFPGRLGTLPRIPRNIKIEIAAEQ